MNLHSKKANKNFISKEAVIKILEEHKNEARDLLEGVRGWHESLLFLIDNCFHELPLVEGDGGYAERQREFQSSMGWALMELAERQKAFHEELYKILIKSAD